MLGNVSTICYNTRMYERWNKYTHVCQSCDALIEYTSTRVVSELTCECGGKCNWVSQEPATILPTTNERQQMETANKEDLIAMWKQELELTYGNEITELKNQLSALQNNHSNCDYWKSENGRVQSQIISLINDAYENETDSSDILESLCEIIDYEAKKTIQFSGTISFSGSIDVPMNEVNDFDLHYFLQDELSLDINHGDTVIDSYEVDDVRESY